MAAKPVPKPAGPIGNVIGRMRDATSGSPLIGVNVTVVGTNFKTKTDIDGNFALPLPPGTYQVRIWYDAYEGMTISGVVVGKDETVNVNRELEPIAGMTQTVAVTAEINKESAAGKLVERKKSVAARDMMSRDDIRKSGGGATSAVRAASSAARSSATASCSCAASGTATETRCSTGPACRARTRICAPSRSTSSPRARCRR